MIITKQQDLERLCAEMRNCPFITIDTEFLREKTYYPKLCLVQVADPEGNAAAIDPIDGKLDLTPLFDLLFDEKILKVIHAGRQDLEIFYNLAKKVVHPIFDTQIAAMVCGHGDSIGYENLVRSLTGESLDKSAQFTDWSKRPLSQRQIDYALGDVTHLVKVYRKLAAELEKRGRMDWALQEDEILSNPETYQNHPENAWERIKLRSPKPKTLAILRELAAWREREAQRRDMPRSWIMRDETLADMAAQAPATPEQLGKIRGVSADTANGKTGRAVIEAVEKALQSDKATWPQPEQRKVMPAGAQATVEILKLLLKIQCGQNDVATKLVASTEDLEAIATQENPDIAPLKGWRRELFGEEALALKKGEVAIGLKDGKIVKFRV